MTRAPHAQLLEYLAAFDRQITEWALALREMVLDEAPEALEVVYDAYSAVAMGYSFTGKLKDQFCHIAAYAHHVNLGFNRGALLPDPAHVLEGTGTLTRHIRVASERDLNRPFLRTYIRSAIEQVGGQSPPPPGASLTTFRGNYTKKRRPKPAR